MEVYSTVSKNEFLVVKVFPAHRRTIKINGYCYNGYDGAVSLKFPTTALIVNLIDIPQHGSIYDNYLFGIYERLSPNTIKLYPLPLPNIGADLKVCMPFHSWCNYHEYPENNLPKRMQNPIFINQLISSFWCSEFSFHVPFSDKFLNEFDAWVKGQIPVREDEKHYFANLTAHRHVSINYLIKRTIFRPYEMEETT